MKKKAIFSGVLFSSLLLSITTAKSEISKSKMQWYMYEVDLCATTQANGDVEYTAKCYVPDPNGPCISITSCNGLMQSP